MKSKPERFLRLEQAFGQLRLAVERDIGRKQAERAEMLRQQEALEASLHQFPELHDLTMVAAMRRLAALANRFRDAGRDIERLRKKAVDYFLKAKRAGELAGRLRRDAEARRARDELGELAGRAARDMDSSLRQEK